MTTFMNINPAELEEYWRTSNSTSSFCSITPSSSSLVCKQRRPRTIRRSKRKLIIFRSFKFPKMDFSHTLLKVKKNTTKTNDSPIENGSKCVQPTVTPSSSSKDRVSLVRNICSLLESRINKCNGKGSATSVVESARNINHNNSNDQHESSKSKSKKAHRDKSTRHDDAVDGEVNTNARKFSKSKERRKHHKSRRAPDVEPSEKQISQTLVNKIDSLGDLKTPSNIFQSSIIAPQDSHDIIDSSKVQGEHLNMEEDKVEEGLVAELAKTHLAVLADGSYNSIATSLFQHLTNVLNATTPDNKNLWLSLIERTGDSLVNLLTLKDEHNRNVWLSWLSDQSKRLDELSHDLIIDIEDKIIKMDGNNNNR